MKKIIYLILAAMIFSSCALRPEGADTKADTALGVTQDEDRQDAEQTLQEMREAQRQEQKRHLERQINDPLAENRVTTN